MKKFKPFYSILIGLFLFSGICFSCKKPSVDPPPVPPVVQPNRSPVAIAGADTIIYAPFNTAVLNGTASFDPDDVHLAFFWKQLSGPTTADFTFKNIFARTVITYLATGIYEFELTVKDTGNLSAKDTVRIIVENNPPCISSGNELILKDMLWETQSYIDENIFININHYLTYLPAKTNITKIFIKRHYSTEWKEVLPFNGNFSGYRFSNTIDNTLFIYPDLSGFEVFIDDNPDIKFVYCKM
jgi:hypothetical protein